MGSRTPIRQEGSPIRKKNVSVGGPTCYRCTDVIRNYPSAVAQVAMIAIESFHKNRR